MKGTQRRGRAAQRRRGAGETSFNLVSEGSIKPRSIPRGGVGWGSVQREAVRPYIATSHRSLPSQHLQLCRWRVIPALILEPRRRLTCTDLLSAQGKINVEKEATAAGRPRLQNKNQIHLSSRPQEKPPNSGYCECPPDSDTLRMKKPIISASVACCDNGNVCFSRWRKS